MAWAEENEGLWMFGVLKDLLSPLLDGIERLREAQEIARKRAFGEVIYRIQCALMDIVETGALLDSHLRAGLRLPRPTTFPGDEAADHPPADALRLQARNVAELGACVDALLELGGYAIDLELSSRLSALIEAKSGAISQLEVALRYFLCPASRRGDTLLVLSPQFDGLLQLTTGDLIAQSIVSPDEIIAAVLRDYAEHSVDVVSDKDRVAAVYTSLFSLDDRLAIDRAIRREAGGRR